MGFRGSRVGQCLSQIVGQRFFSFFLQLLLLIAVLRHAVVLVLRDVEEVDVAVLVLKQLCQLLQSTKKWREL